MADCFPMNVLTSFGRREGRGLGRWTGDGREGEVVYDVVAEIT